MLSPHGPQSFLAPKSHLNAGCRCLWSFLEISLSFSDPQALLKMRLEPWSSFGNHIYAFLHSLGIALSRKYIIRKGHGSNVYIRQVRVGNLGLCKFGKWESAFFTLFFAQPPYNPVLCSSGEWRMDTVWSETFLHLKAISSAGWPKCCPRDGRFAVS